MYSVSYVFYLFNDFFPCGFIMQQKWFCFNTCTKQTLTNSLDFCKDDINIGAGDGLAINNFAVFAQFSPIFPVHLLPGGFGVTMDCKLLKGLQEFVHVCALCHIGYSAKQIVRPWSNGKFTIKEACIICQLQEWYDK